MRVKPSQHEGEKRTSGCQVLKDGVRAVAGFGQARKHKQAMHFGKLEGAHTQFICLQALVCESYHGGASNCMTSVMNRKKSITMSLCHRVGDLFGNREGIWKQGSELPTHSGSRSRARLNKHIHSCFWHNRCTSTNNSPPKSPAQALCLQNDWVWQQLFYTKSCTESCLLLWTASFLLLR